MMILKLLQHRQNAVTVGAKKKKYVDFFVTHTVSSIRRSHEKWLFFKYFFILFCNYIIILNNESIFYYNKKLNSIF